MLHDFNPSHLNWLLPLAGAILGVVFSVYWEFPISFEIPLPLKYKLPLVLLLLVWFIVVPVYVKHRIGESAQAGFIRGGQHYVYDYDWLQSARDDGATRYYRVSAGRWWWLLFAGASGMHLTLVFAGFLATQWGREGIKRGVRALRSSVPAAPADPRRVKPVWTPIVGWRASPIFRTPLVRYPVIVILTFWLCGWALGWCGAAREIARGGPLLKQLFLLGWLGVWSLVGLANLWFLWELLRPARKRSK
jgi:hypothetical protein